MPYGLAYNPNGLQQSTNTAGTGANPYAVAPTFQTAATFKNPNLPNNYLDPATHTYHDWGSMADAMTAQNAATVGKVDWYNNWRQRAMQGMNPDQQAAFTKQFKGQFAFDWAPNTAVNRRPAPRGYGLQQPQPGQPPAQNQPPSQDPFGDYWSKQMGVSPDEFNQWYDQRNTAPKQRATPQQTVAMQDAYDKQNPRYGEYGT